MTDVPQTVDAQNQPATETEVSENKLRALVIDDSRAARTMIGNMLKQLGFEIETAEHGADALQKLDPGCPPEAILVDWNMPVMDGVAFARSLRNMSAFSTTPLLMISSESDPRRVASALLAGVDEYLFKPIDAEMIKSRLEILGVYVGSRA